MAPVRGWRSTATAASFSYVLVRLRRHGRTVETREIGLVAMLRAEYIARAHIVHLGE